MTRPPSQSVIPASVRIANSYYAQLGLHPSASAVEIRRAYRDLSKRYHPDTTSLPKAIATVKSQQLNEAYSILSNPERRARYDLQIGYSRYNVIQPSPPPTAATSSQAKTDSNTSAYLDPVDRPLSSGELFVLALLAIAFAGCIGVVLIIAWLRGDALLTVPAVIGLWERVLF